MTLSYLEYKANTRSAITVKLATSVAKQCFYAGKAMCKSKQEETKLDEFHVNDIVITVHY